MENHYQMRVAVRIAMNVEAKVSEDSRNWSVAYIKDISSGGLKFLVDKKLNIGDVLFFELHINGVMREFLIKSTAVILRRDGTKNGLNIYCVKFNDMSNKDQIELDEFVHYYHVHGAHNLYGDQGYHLPGESIPHLHVEHSIHPHGEQGYQHGDHQHHLYHNYHHHNCIHHHHHHHLHNGGSHNHHSQNDKQEPQKNGAGGDEK